MQIKSSPQTVELPSDLKPESRVWIYQSVPPIPEDNREELRDALQSFAKQWVAHDKALTAEGHLLYDRFIVLIADETHHQASGCSIDASVQFLKSLEEYYDLSLFDRMEFSYLDAENYIRTCAAEAFSSLYEKGSIHEDTLVFDHTVQRKEELEQKWIKPLKESFHNRFV